MLGQLIIKYTKMNHTFRYLLECLGNMKSDN